MPAGNVAAVLAAREVGAARHCSSGRPLAGTPAELDGALRAWAEADSLRRCSASYCELSPPTRSTIAAAFSPDGSLLASTQCAPRPRAHPARTCAVRRVPSRRFLVSGP
jgi:hypothetical protein